MVGFIIVIHVIACILLIAIVLIQSGRGGGLVEGFSGVESMFGPKTNAFLTRSTTVLSILFFITCLTLAALSSRQSKSIMERLVVPAAEEQSKAVPLAVLPSEPAHQTQQPQAEPAQTQQSGEKK